MTRHLCIRSQHAKTGRSGFAGPDIYIAVQEVPDGVEPLKALRADSARKRGIRIVYFGEGYSKHRGPRSAYGKALAAARAYLTQQGA